MPRNNPAAPAATGAILRITPTILAQGQLYETVLDYMATTGTSPSFADLTTFLTNWRSAVETHLLAVLPTSVSIVKYTIAEVRFGTVPTLALPLSPPQAGTVVAAQLNGILAAIITKYSPLKGQHGRGRTYLMSVPSTFQSSTDTNQINNTGLAAYATLAGALLLPIAVGGITYGLAISTRPSPPNLLVTNSVPVSLMVTEQVLGTIRRRREGRGI